MNNVFEITLLLDFYGQLLTDRQYEILDLHYNNDYSLGEIAEQLNISRQGVYDNVKRGKAQLNEMEEKLGLVKKFAEHKTRAEEVLKLVKSINPDNLSNEDKQCLNKVEEGINDIINKF
ncbi:MAG: YlxM family DNA-binding protein [Dehalococcoidia bacterium]|nr:YlxM family DNA-binding protein [Dehalococcoidia bacterium]